ncbi:glycosyltransferase family A protein [Psychroserpens sp. AS72]|uniref:glycosyltransferase family A protein n=1 Tax=Psychroserpens sp. AS72 TaxID=3135775 RepID=UPI00316FC8D3
MKTGIIIIFHNYEKEINIDFFINCCKKVKDIEFCLVDNQSKDDTYLILEEVKEQCDNVSIVNIKKFKSDISAVKSGARYMFNHFKLRHLGYINANLLNKQYQGFNTIIQAISEHQDAIIKYDKKIIKSHRKRKTLFQKLFSVSEYLTKLELERQADNLHYQSKF